MPLADPLLCRVKKSSPWLEGSGELLRMEMSPCGFSAPEEEEKTFDVIVTGVPCVNDVEESCKVVMVGRNVIMPQFVTSTFASILPRPLARS
jgi:hypothetical protein